MHSIEQKFVDWLKENNAYLVSAIMTPKGEYIAVENFVPAGWQVVFAVKENHERVNDVSTVDTRNGNSGQ